VRIVDLGESSVDRLARAVRFRLRRDHGVLGGVPVVLSAERPRCALVPAGDPGANPLDYQARARRGCCALL
jgi:tRNA A37 threonylcarbamoyladenosine dehydratase